MAQDTLLEELQRQAALLIGSKEQIDESENVDANQNLEKLNNSDTKVVEDSDSSSAANKVNESINMENSFIGLFDGENLTEEFKVKITALFEATVAERVAKIEEELKTADDAELKKLTEQTLAESTQYEEGLADKVDGYLDYMIEQWMTNNELALDRGIRSELFESFITGMRNLFESHNINIPEGKLEVVDELRESNEALEASLDEMLAENVELKQTLRNIKKAEMIREAANGLTDIDADRFYELAESMSFENEEVFAQKLTAIRENFFQDDATLNKQLIESVVDDTPILNEDTSKPRVDPTIDAYVSALSRIKI